MPVKKLIEVWDGKNIIDNNIIFLKKKTNNVSMPISDESKQIIKDLKDTYLVTPCAGIAANQLGYNKSIFIGLKYDDYDANESEKKEKTIGNPNADNFEFYINPKIIHSTKKSIQESEEGCLSIPEVRLIAERFDKIKVQYFNLDGDKIKKPLSGFMSLLFQHELDHLNGVLMVENSKIKQVYKISNNQNIESLYPTLIEKLSR